MCMLNCLLKCSHQAFDWQEWNKLLVHWVVASNQPFMEVENKEFHAMIAHLRPFVEKKLIKADRLKDLTMEYALKAREWLKEHLKVSNVS